MMKNTILGFAAVLMASCTPALKVDVGPKWRRSKA